MKTFDAFLAVLSVFLLPGCMNGGSEACSDCLRVVSLPGEDYIVHQYYAENLGVVTDTIGVQPVIYTQLYFEKDGQVFLMAGQGKAYPEGNKSILLIGQGIEYAPGLPVLNKPTTED